MMNGEEGESGVIAGWNESGDLDGCHSSIDHVHRLDPFHCHR